jgi:hypothetical protein
MRLAVPLAWLGLALALLIVAQPHEDALILFRFARNLGHGFGIVYFPGGPRAEGATDFLFMLALAAGERLGVDAAIGAAILNAAGAALAAWIFRDALSPRLRPLTVLLLGVPAAGAGYLGFGAMLFSAVALLLFHLFRRGTVRAIPPIALVLALLRPDGAVLGAGFVALGALRPTRGYAAIAIACGALGAAYFAWRWRYFGMALPLPLYVKQHSAERLPGLSEAIDWVLSSVVPLAMPLAAARAFFGPPRRGFALGLLPFGVHAVALLFGVPSQNVCDRFEAPTTLALLYAVGASAKETSRGFGIWLGALLAAYAAPFCIAVDAVAAAFERSYVPSFAHALGKIPATRLAVTEAGTVPYWTDAPTLDLVGLSSPETAKEPPSEALLERFAPDVVMIHPAATLDEACFARGATAKVVPIEGSLAPCVRPFAQPLFRVDLGPYTALRVENIFAAAAATAAWLDRRRDEYDLYAARFESRFSHYHVFAFRRASPGHDAYLRALEAAETGRGRVAYISE